MKVPRVAGVGRALLVVAVTSLPLAYVANAWRRGEFAFQREHDSLARLTSLEAGRLRSLWQGLLRQKEAHRDCADCGAGRPCSLLRRVDEAEAMYRLFASEANWHARLAGPAFARPLGDRFYPPEEIFGL